MDRKTYFIGILTLTAAVLLVATFLVPAPVALGDSVIKDRDYQMVTAHSQTGGDALYIVDNRSGRMAVFSYDTTTRRLELRASAPIMDAFPGVR